MRTILYLIILIFLPFSMNAQALGWVNGFGNSGFDDARAIKTDSDGNVYVLGHFENTVDFEPGLGTTSLSSNGNYDIYLLKLSAQGHLIWVKSFGGSGRDYPRGLAIDNAGNLLLTGLFSSVVDFDPNGGTQSISSQGFDDIFISKIDPNGNLLWVNTFGSSNYDEGWGVITDANNNVLITGYFNGTVDFDPGTTTQNLSSSAGSRDIFVAKYNAQGNYMWAESMGGSGDDVGTSLDIDGSGNVFILSIFEGTADLDPGAGNTNTVSQGGDDIGLIKLSSTGNYLWSHGFGSTGREIPRRIQTLSSGDIIIAGDFENTIDFDPSANVVNHTSNGLLDFFIVKYSTTGNLLFSQSTGSTGNDRALSLEVDNNQNIYYTGFFENTVDFDPGTGTDNYTSLGDWDGFVSKLDPSGVYQWTAQLGGTGRETGINITLDNNNDILTSGYFSGTTDFAPGSATFNQTSNGSFDFFVLKLYQSGVLGYTYKDLNPNCIFDNNESGLAGRSLIIQPGNIVAQSNSSGIWYVPNLPAGSYTATVDTNGNWTPTCPITQNFTVASSSDITTGPDFGFESTSPCSSPNVSIFAPFLRPGFSNQKVYVSACNDYAATDLLDSAYVIVELDSLFIPDSASVNYTSLGNNQYQVDVGDLYPGQCVEFYFNCTLNQNAVLGQTLCMDAELLPVDSCALDTIAQPFPTGTVSACNTPWDKSSLMVTGKCENDTICFTIYNTGDPVDGDMTCFAPVRLYIDGQYVLFDSIQLNGGDSTQFCFAGDGRTWRLEADQHPLHPGNSHPNATVERCGNAANWTPGLVNILPPDDADPVIDIYCGVVTGSYDPNDKTGFPLGIDSANYINQNQDIEYLIRFQNTGTDTAFNVVIRDTLPAELDIFTLQSGASSHDYTFTIQGPRVLEWTFNNIMLPDSNVNEPASHGFVKFKVKQNQNLPIGTTIENNAAIFFDFNAPIITNTYLHTIGEQDLNWDGQQTINVTACDNFQLGGYFYNHPGTYYHPVTNGGLDSLYTIIVAPDNTIDNSVTFSNNMLSANLAGATYQWLDCDNGFAPIVGAISQNFFPTQNGNYAVEISKSGCTVISDCQQVLLSAITIPHPGDTKLKVYPNPTNDLVWVDLSELPTNFQTIPLHLYNIQGQLVQSIQRPSTIQKIDLSELPAGLYILQVTDSQQNYKIKIIKK